MTCFSLLCHNVISWNGIDTNLVLLRPKTSLNFSNPLRKLIREFLAREYKVSEETFQAVVGSEMECWGKLKWKDGKRATIHAREIITTIGRDMSYIKVSGHVPFYL